MIRQTIHCFLLLWISNADSWFITINNSSSMDWERVIGKPKIIEVMTVVWKKLIPMRTMAVTPTLLLSHSCTWRLASMSSSEHTSAGAPNTSMVTCVKTQIIMRLTVIGGRCQRWRLHAVQQLELMPYCGTVPVSRSNKVVHHQGLHRPPYHWLPSCGPIAKWWGKL